MKLDLSRGKDTPLSKKAYGILLKWIGYSRDKFHEWTGEPNCGYFFDGAYYYGADQCYTALAYAVAVKLGDYDERLTGLSRPRAMEMVIKTIRYLCFTHDTGPKEGVRVMGKNPLTGGTKWGGEGEDFFRATQVGNSLMNLGLACWLLWDDLNEETHRMLFNIFSSYGDKWSNESPRNGVYMDTQAEENGWTAAGIAVCAVLFPNHPRAHIWREGVLKWALNCASVVDDWIKRDDVWGRPLNNRVFTVTFHPDYTAENHHFVHPNYMGAPIEHTGIITLYTRLAGVEDFPMIARNIDKIYDRTLRIWAGPDGSPIPVQSQDWWYYNTPRAAGVNAYMNVLHGSSHGSYLERLSLDIVARVQDGNGNGCFYEREPEKCIVSSNNQDIGDMEHRAASHIALVYLIHYFLGDGTLPKARDEFMEDVRGVYSYPNGGVVVKQSAESFACFSLRNNVLAATLPKDRLFSITVPPSSTMGYIKVKAGKDGAGSPGIFKLEDERVNLYDQGFGVSGKIIRGLGEIVQNVGFAALPDGNTAYFEKIDVIRDCTAEHIKTGLVGVRNDNKEGIPEYLKGYRDIVVFNGGRDERRFYGKYGEERDIIYRWENVDRLTMDGQISYILHDSRGVEYVNHRYYPQWKGVEDYILLNSFPCEITLSSGEKILPFTMFTVPNCNSDKIRDVAFTVCDTPDDDMRVVIGGDYLIYVNFSKHGEQMKGSYRIEDKIQIFDGYMEIKRGKVNWTGGAKGGECGYIRSRGRLNGITKLKGANFEIFGAGKKHICLRNRGDFLAILYKGKRYDIPGGETVVL